MNLDEVLILTVPVGVGILVTCSVPIFKKQNNDLAKYLIRFPSLQGLVMQIARDVLTQQHGSISTKLVWRERTS